jgi:hypothetical protein
MSPTQSRDDSYQRCKSDHADRGSRHMGARGAHTRGGLASERFQSHRAPEIVSPLIRECVDLGEVGRERQRELAAEREVLGKERLIAVSTVVLQSLRQIADPQFEDAPPVQLCLIQNGDNGAEQCSDNPVAELVECDRGNSQLGALNVHAECGRDDPGRVGRGDSRPRDR